MPWVSISTPRAVAESSQVILKGEIARILLEELGKEEKGLFIGFEHLDGLYREGVRDGGAAMVNVRYIGRFSLAQKQAVTSRLCTVLAARLDVDARKIIVLFQEMESADWGRNAGEYT
jgi:phenylpyruvate tautomerase PptA (4-oxalocrotonate tautomerase family)